MDECAQSPALLLRSGDNAGDLPAVAERHFAAGAVDGELLEQVPEQALGVAGENVFQFDDVLEFASIRQRAGRVDRRPELKGNADERVDAAARGRVAVLRASGTASDSRR